MVPPQSSALLWINKDATNVHTKKHIAEVNAHVQKRTTKKRASRKQTSQKKGNSLIRNEKRNEKSQSPGLSTPSTTILEVDDDESIEPLEKVNETVLSLRVKSQLPLDQATNADQTSFEDPAAVVFSSYTDDGIGKPDGFGVRDMHHFTDDHDITEFTMQLNASVPAAVDLSNPMPGLLTNLSARDKMLVHTHLTYMPWLFYGLTKQATYCPIRTASVVNMLRAPVGTIWVIISLEMFLETARKSNERKAAILKKKSQAYQIMSQNLQEQSQLDHVNLLLGPASAAIAEIFCGDSSKGLTHLNGIDAYITARGGLEYVKKMDFVVCMPIFAIFSYRTLLQDNLDTYSKFEQARQSFTSILKSLLHWSHKITHMLASGTGDMSHASPSDEGFDGEFDLAEGVREFAHAREKAFHHNALMQKFVRSEYSYTKLGERVDHFIILYNLNIALHDHGTNYRQATHFLNNFVNDVETGGSTKGVDSSIKVAGVSRLLTNRQARMSPHHLSAGVVRAWVAIDGLEIMKLLSRTTQQFIRQTLHQLLLGQLPTDMNEEKIDRLNAIIVNEWHARHPG